ncbi:aminotransferase class IV [Desulfosarcina sp.]|uniref:aminotransferase class IV n=1 Tax=Desulfosarcina sp. TaxID=2027861 RepID=UPI0029A28720|nr:aminotransferase class IV [Desulfosarcina sp.]MDX2455073.1 aminotransferase class IV [Desulfosarcina sp.]MDX2512551.1 aminotransferase class IV [Desulfobacterales bacterium]
MSDFSNGAAYVDEKFVPITEAKISILDWGFLHSDATYDVAHVWQGKFFRLDDHIERFLSGIDRLRMSIPYNRGDLRSILVDCVKASGLREAYVEMICTRGRPKPGSRDPRECTNRLFVFAVPFVWIANPEKQKKGLHLIISHIQRIPPESVDPTVKNYHWLDMVMGLFEAYDRGGETVAVVDAQGNLVEGPGFNIFVVNGNKITTPAHGVLEGITRRTVIELSTEYGYEAIQHNLSADKARTADEMFVTSTAGGVIPVTKIDGGKIGSGMPGPVTQKLQEGYWMVHQDPRYTFDIEYD